MGIQKAYENAKYRLINYHLRKDIDDGVLLCNTVTGELVLLNKEEEKILDSLPAPFESGMQELCEHHFFVTEDYDEHKVVLQLRKIMRLMNSTKKEITGYTILPTTCYNARCFYCYEAGCDHITMTDKTAADVAEFIAKNCGEKKQVNLSWFGGEPTLGIKQIDRICKGLAEKEVKYSSSMVSNGYLFDEDVAKKNKRKFEK